VSYILDALKKSEKERRRGSVPDPLTMQDIVLRTGRKKVLWPYLIVAALVFNAVVFLFWSDFLTAKKPMMAKALSGGKVSSVENAAPPAPSEREVGERVTQEAGRGGAERDSTGVLLRDKKNVAPERSAGVQADGQRKAADSRKPVREAAKDHRSSGAASVEQATATAPAESKTVDVPPPVANRLYSLNELPSPLRQGLPDFSLSVFLYSDDAASRLVRINGQMMKEGQYLSPGIKLEEIVPGGVIFSYQRYRFLIAPR